MQFHVLAVDDSLTIRKLLEMVLGKSGYNLELASTGHEGIERALRTPPDLILLDYVLPDMKGNDVCAALQKHEQTKNVPVVVMSAKGEDARLLFKDARMVVDFMHKPFTPPQVSFVVANILRSQSLKKSAAVTPRDQADGGPAQREEFTADQMERGAKIIYSALKSRFARIPEWIPGMDKNAPGPYFANKLLTPDLMVTVMPAFQSLLKESIQAAGTVESKQDSADVMLKGQTGLLNAISLLKLLAGCGKTGLLELQQGERTTFVYLRRGVILLVSHNIPKAYQRQARTSVEGITQDEVLAAEQEQKKTGKPVYVSHCEKGKMQSVLLQDVLMEQGQQALLEAIDGEPGDFVVRSMTVLPDYVEAHGRPYSLDQLNLNRLRQVDDWSQVEVHVNSLDLIFKRCDQFTKSLEKYTLTETERRVLTLVNNRNTVKKILERGGISTFEVFHTLFRLNQVGLIVRGAANPKNSKPGSYPPGSGSGQGVNSADGTLTSGSGKLSGSHPAVMSSRQTVVLAESDVIGVQKPLALHIERKRGMQVVGSSADDGVFSVIKRVSPRLAVVNVDLPGLEAPALAAEVRNSLEISDMSLVAIMDREDVQRAESLRAAGFDLVLVKPFLVSDLDPLLHS